MKKTLRFSLLCCLLLAVILTVSACLDTQTPEETTPQTSTSNVTIPEGTTPEETTPEATTPEATTPEETTPEEVLDPDKPEGAVLVDSIGGKSAKEVMENFVDSFNNAESYDWSATMESIEDGIVVSQYMSIKFYNGEVAVIMQSDDMTNEVYFVNGVLYINNNGQKMKLSSDNPEEMLGEGFYDGLFDLVPDFSEEKELALEDTKIYLLNGIYYITLHKVDEDTNEEEIYCYQFNEAGDLVKAESTSNNESAILIINSYGKPVQINPPADADEYTTIGNAVAPEGAVAVDTVNGMNATQLFEKFIAEYSASTAYDIRISMKQTFAEETVTISMAVMLTQDAVYYGMASEGSIVKIWVVDGTAYMFSDGERIKQTGVSIEDVFVDGTFESLIGSVVADIPDEYYTQLAEAQLYYYEGLYFYTITMFQADTGMTTEIVFFDETGTVVRVIDQADGLSMDQTINSYGNKPVLITPPADADQYVDANAIPEAPKLPETEDEIYDLYSDMCTMLQDSDHFSVYIDIGGVYYVVYEIAGDNKHLMLDGEENVEQWLIDQAGYISVDYEAILEVDVDVAFLESFVSFEEVFPIDVFAQEELQNLRCSYDEEWGEIVIEFEYASDSEHLSQCKYALAADASYVDITVIEFVSGEEDVTCNFFFTIDPELEITLPEIE